MPGDSSIEWTDATWNPVTGCTQVSRGCDHCYALTFAERWRGIPGHPYEQGFDLKLWPERLSVPLKWTKPRRIFVNSMSDLFHADVPTDFIVQVFAVMAMSPRHTYQVLTKRPQRMMKLLNSPEFVGLILPAALELCQGKLLKMSDVDRWFGDWPLPNVWLGTSVEDQEAAYRIDFLAKTPAAVRFLSCEPLLGPLDLSKHLCHAGMDCVRSPWLYTHVCPDNHVDWVITGGESGPGFRPCDPDWVRSIRDQCAAAGVPFFHKQWGGIRSKAGGRELDGQIYDAMPAIGQVAQTTL